MGFKQIPWIPVGADLSASSRAPSNIQVKNLNLIINA